MSSTNRADTARGFYSSSSIALGITATAPGDPLFAARRFLGARFPKLATEALGEVGPHLIADVEEGRATLAEAVFIGLQRVEGALRRRIAGELAVAQAPS